MKLKKLLTALLAVTMVSFSASAVLADNIESLKAVEHVEEVDVKQEFSFGSFTGKVKEIRDYEPIKGATIIAVENEEGMPANIVVSDQTYVVNKEQLTVGAIITAYYNANAPMLLIYPPQYNAEVVVVKNPDYNVKVDIFDSELVSQDHQLKLNISDDTKIVLPDGTPYEGEIANRKLVVIYGPSTKSIPAQTTPIKIIVLPDEKKVETTNVSDMDIIVNEQKIGALAAYTNDQGAIMIPLRAVTKALGYDTKWDKSSQSVIIGKGIGLTIGKDTYTYMKTAPIVLGNVPELVEGTTFVPIEFFEKVMKVDRAYISESQIIINTMNEIK